MDFQKGIKRTYLTNPAYKAGLKLKTDLETNVQNAYSVTESERGNLY